MSKFFEPLEDRKLFSVSLLSPVTTITGQTNLPIVIQLSPVRLSGTQLIINGTSGPDTITVNKVGTTLAVNRNGSMSWFNEADVKSISMLGAGGDDKLSLSADNSIPATIDGGNGNDELTGGANADVLFGRLGNDTLRGQGGSDILSGGDGVDDVRYDEKTTGVKVTIDGVANDGVPSASIIIGSGATRRIVMRVAENDNVENDIESVWGTNYNDNITGSAAPNWLFGLKGNDRLDGAAGDDTLYGYYGNDTLIGNYGNDQLFGEYDNDDLQGGVGWDTVHYNDWYGHSEGVFVSIDNVADDGESTEFDNVHTDVEVVYGTEMADDLNGSINGDYLIGLGGNDIIRGNGGNDTLHGELGNDSIYGGAGADLIYGDGNNDLLDGGISGSADFWQNVGNDTIYGGAGNDTLFASDFSDNVLYGEDNNDILVGNQGRDDLYGGNGNDSLIGGDNDDGLYGGQGTDTLTGGAGDDRFLDNTWEEAVGDYFAGVKIGSHNERRWSDTVIDHNPNDARLGFTNGKEETINYAGQSGKGTYAAANWSDQEIQTMDNAFRTLHRATSNTRLLKTIDGGGLIFFRQGSKTSGTGTFTAGAWNSGGGLHLTNDSFSSTPDYLYETVLHEIGHNWDDTYNASAWRAVSGWTQSNMSTNPNYTQGTDSSGSWYYLKTAGFASGYAMVNPNEDFAESFAKYMLDRGGFTSGLTNVVAKSNFMSAMVNALS